MKRQAPHARVVGLAAAAFLIMGRWGSAADPFWLKGGETIVFFGDSITQAGDYVVYTEAALLTRFSEKSFRLFNRGISSETVSGTSEPDHDPRRPNALLRFDRDVASLRPDVVVACFGMNDGNYHPFEAERFRRFQSGVAQLRALVRKLPETRLVLLTPPPFDAYRRQVSDPQAISFGYRFPAIDYDQTLAEYSRWLVTQQGEEVRVADAHALINQHLKSRRGDLVSFSVSPDAVHPDATGHWLMAQALLTAWNFPAVVSEVSLDARTGSAEEDPGVADFEARADSLSFTWTAPLPLPADTRWNAESIAHERVSERFNRCRLKVARLKGGRYRLLADGQKCGEASRRELERGIDLTRFAAFPTTNRAAMLLALLSERQRLDYSEWRKSIGRPLAEAAEADTHRASHAAEKRRAQLDREIETLRQPIRIRVQIVPAPAE